MSGSNAPPYFGLGLSSGQADGKDQAFSTPRVCAKWQCFLASR